MSRYAQFGGDYAGPFSRRTFMRLAAAGAIGSAVAASANCAINRETQRRDDIQSILNERDTIRAYKRKEAQELLHFLGPEAVEKEGLKQYLDDPGLRALNDPEKILGQPSWFYRNSSLTKWLAFAAPSILVYLGTSKAPEKMYEALQDLLIKARRGRLNRREMLAYAGIAALLGYNLSGCRSNGGGVITGPSDTANIVTRVIDSNGNPVSGVILDYMASESGPISASGPVINGVCTMQGVTNPGAIKRYRIRGDGRGEPLSILTIEKDLTREITRGDNNLELMAKKKTANLPWWYDVTIRNESPVGNKKTIGPIKYVANPAGIEGSRQLRLQQVEDAVKYAVSILGLEYVPNETFQLTSSQIESGNNIFPITFAQAFGTTHYKYDNNQLLGTKIILPQFGPDNITDISEIFGATRFPGESNDIRPSIVNDDPPHGRVEPPDLESLAASEFDGLKSRNFTSMGGIPIESFHPPLR